MVEAAAQELSSELPSKALNKSEASLKDLEDALEKFKRMQKLPKASGGEMKELMSTTKVRMDAATEWAETVGELIEDARA